MYQDVHRYCHRDDYRPIEAFQGYQSLSIRSLHYDILAAASTWLAVMGLTGSQPHLLRHELQYTRPHVQLCTKSIHPRLPSDRLELLSNSFCLHIDSVAS